MRNPAVVVMVVGALASSQAPGHADPYANAPAYAKPLDSSTRIKPFLTTGQRIPLTGGAGTYLVVGLPDGLGLYRKGDHLILLSNHEFRAIHGESQFAICEDPGYDLSADLGFSRDTDLWIYNIETRALTAVAELNREAARTHALAADAGNSNAPARDSRAAGNSAASWTPRTTWAAARGSSTSRRTRSASCRCPRPWRAGSICR